MKSSGFNNFQFLWKEYETKSNRRTANSHSNTASKENDDNNNYTKDNFGSLWGELSVEPITNPTDIKQQNPLQNPNSSYSKIFTGQIPNPSTELKYHFSETFYLNKLDLKMNLYDYNIKEELKLRINYYENKSWNVNSWHNT